MMCPRFSSAAFASLRVTSISLFLSSPSVTERNVERSGKVHSLSSDLELVELWRPRGSASVKMRR